MTNAPQERTPVVENLENFTVAELFGKDWDTIAAKTEFFSRYFREMCKDGFIMRRAQQAASHKMEFFDQRTPQRREVLMFGSNNYLGLANEPFIVDKTIEAIRLFGIGAGGPPLLNGYTDLHAQLEARLAALKGCEDAIIFSSGYATNLGWATGLLSANDLLIYDAQSHASLFDAMRLGRFQSMPFAHNDMDALRTCLMQARWNHPYTNVVVCVEGVYSMDGDIAPLAEVRRLCTKYGALLAVDDAHGTGVLGKHGRGTAEHFELEGQIDIAMGTFSKTFAVTGGFVAGARSLVEYLRFFARSYMFSASLPTPVVASVLASLEFIEAHPERIEKLQSNTRYLADRLRENGFFAECQSAIIPLFVKPGVNMRQIVRRMHEEGVFLNGVEYPAVPRDRQRLRISMMATFSEEELDFAAQQITRVAEEFDFLGYQPEQGASNEQ